MADKKDQPDALGLAQSRQLRVIEICRDSYGGTPVMRKKRNNYLPQFPKESAKKYEERVNSSVFYDAFKRTVKGLTGLIFRERPKLGEKIDTRFRPLWENIDNRGTHADVFCRERHEDGEIDGLFAIFVDMQPVDPTIKTRGEEQALKRRPWWIGIRATDVISAEYTVENGVPILSHFRYRDCFVQRDGKYGQKEVEQIREYNLGPRTGDDPSGKTARIVRYMVHEKKQNDTGKEEEWIVVEGPALMEIDEIPVVVAYLGDREGDFEAAPPHLALAYENVKHFQLVSDNDNVLHTCAVPIFVRVGYQDPGQGQEVGPTVGLDLPLGGDAKYISPDGIGLDQMAKRIEKSEYRMAILGLSMLMSDTKAQETATSKRIDKAESDSALSSHARASQDAFEEALRLTAKWLDIELPERNENERWIDINRNFEDLQVDPQILNTLATLVANNKLTQETLWEILVKSKVLPETFDPDTETSELESRGLDQIKQAMDMAKAQGKVAGPGAEEEDDEEEEEDEE